jgi:hypothetical protein
MGVELKVKNVIVNKKERNSKKQNKPKCQDK